MMKRNLRSSSVLGTALGLMVLVGCEEPNPLETAVSPPGVVRPSEPPSDEVRAALSDVIRDTDPYSRARRLAVMLPTLGPAAVPSLREILEDQSLDLGAPELELLVRRWGAYQPDAATSWAFDRASAIYRASTVYSAIMVWAEVDPQAAAAAVAKRMDREISMRAVMQIALVRGWYAASGSSVELEQYIQDLGKSFTRQRALSAYIRSIIQAKGVEAAGRWATALPDDDRDRAYKQAAYRQVAAALPLFDYGAAMRWCDAQCEGPYGMDLRRLIASRWVLDDGPAAVEWLRSAPDGDDKNLGLRMVYANWGRADREAALAWVEEQTRERIEPWMAPIMPVYAQFVAADSPTDAIAWAQRIEDDENREQVLILVARDWRRSDVDAAEAWLQQSSLSEEARDRSRREHGSGEVIGGAAVEENQPGS